jgi:ABC-type sugar transport system substrate-binding protein
MAMKRASRFGALHLLAVAAISFASASAAEKKPVKVFVLAGQSNKIGRAHV